MAGHGFKRNTFNVSPASRGAANIINSLLGNNDPGGNLFRKGQLQGAQISNTFSRARNTGLRNQKLSGELADQDFLRQLFPEGSLEHQGVIDPRFSQRQTGLATAAKEGERATSVEGLRKSNAKVNVGGADVFLADLLGEGTGADAFNVSKISPEIANKLSQIKNRDLTGNVDRILKTLQGDTEFTRREGVEAATKLTEAKIPGALAKSAKSQSELKVQTAVEDFEIAIKENNAGKSKVALEKIIKESKIKDVELKKIKAEFKGFARKLQLKDANDRLSGLKTEAEIYKLIQQTEDTSGLTDFQKAKFFMDNMEDLRTANIFKDEDDKTRLTEQQMIEQSRVVVQDLTENGVLKKAVDSLEKNPDFEVDSLMSEGALGLLLKMVGDRGGSAAPEADIQNTLGIQGLQDVVQQPVAGPEGQILDTLTAQEPIDATNPQQVAPPGPGPTLAEQANPALNPVTAPAPIATQDVKFGASPHLDQVFATKGIDGLIALADVLDKKGDPQSQAGLKVLIAYIKSKQAGGQ